MAEGDEIRNELPLLVVRVADGVHVIQQEVDADIASDEAEQRADEHPEEERRTVFLEVEAVARRVVRESVADAVEPVEVVDATGQDAEEDELEKPRVCLPSPSQATLTSRMMV